MTTLVERLDLPAALPRARSRRDTETDTVQFAQAALAAAKQEGLQLAVRARYVALAVIACLLPIINPSVGTALLCGAAWPVRADWLGSGQGWAGRRVETRACAVVLRPRAADVHRRCTESLQLCALAGGDAIPFRQLHLFLRAAVGRDTGLFLAHCHRGRNVDLRSLDCRHGLGVVAARSRSRADRPHRSGDRQRSQDCSS